MKNLVSLVLFISMALFVSFLAKNAAAADDDLIAHYKFDGDMKDEIGSNDGEKGAGPGDVTYMKDRDDKEDGAILFGGTGDDWYRIDLGTYSPSQEGEENEMTCAFWGYWNGNTGSWQDIINKREHFGNGEMMWGINQHDATDDVLSVRKAGMDADFSEGMPEEEWTHVVITMDNTDATLYVNGEKIESQPYEYGEMTDAGIYAGTSKNGHVDAYNGALDELMFFSRMLTAEEIDALYETGSIVGVKPSLKPPVASLTQNALDPFGSTITIGYTLGENTRTEISVYELSGNKVATLVNGFKMAGTYSAAWDVSGLSDGVYLYRLRTAGFSATGKVELIR